MIVIRSDKDDDGGNKPGKGNNGGNKPRRSFLPLVGIVAIFVLLFLLVPLGIVYLFHLPWYLMFIYPYGIFVGAVLVIVGVWFIYRGIKGLRLSYSASGYEGGDDLVTTGAYAYTRNPMYFGGAVMIIGWFLILPYTFILIAAILFIVLFYITAKSEEKQLQQRYGKKYLAYKRKVPLFVPYRFAK